MADLKTRKAVKGTVKTIDRAAVAAELPNSLSAERQRISKLLQLRQKDSTLLQLSENIQLPTFQASTITKKDFPSKRSI